MTVIGFKDRFVDKVRAREKKHTIRRTPKDGVLRHKVGRPIQLYTRVRQPDAHKIVDVDPVCTKIERIQISGEGQYSVIIERGSVGELLSPEEILGLALADGFGSVEAFFEFFVPARGDVFQGHIVHWDWP